MAQTGSDLQAQIDRLSLALHQWRQSQDQLQPMEQRLSELTDRCAAILSRWSDTDKRHAHAINEIEERLREWGAIESRLQHDAVERLRGLERTIEHEWHSLRRIHEEPVRQLRDQAAALGETCMAAANLALRSFERAEARFSALETDLQSQLRQLAQEIRTALADPRGDAARPRQLASPAAPFPLDGVLRIHDELREQSSGAVPDVPVAAPIAAPAAEPPRQLPESSALAERMATLERAVSSGREEALESSTHWERMRRNWRVGLTIAGILLVAATVFGISVQRRINAQLDDAATRAASAERQAAAATQEAARQIAATRADAERQIADARQTASQAQLISNILAAPDLRRFSLVGVPPADRAYAQVLLSRSRGLVLSGARLPAVPAGSTYQIWLLTTESAVSAGVFAPDTAGRVSIVADPPASMPAPISGVLVTLEPAGGTSGAPSGATVLARAQQ